MNLVRTDKITSLTNCIQQPPTRLKSRGSRTWRHLENDFRLVLQTLISPTEIDLCRRDTFCLRLDCHTAWGSAALQQDELPVLANYRRGRKGMQLTCTIWMQSDSIPKDSIRKHIAPVNPCVSILHYLISTGRYLLGVQFITNLDQTYAER